MVRLQRGGEKSMTEEALTQILKRLDGIERIIRKGLVALTACDHLGRGYNVPECKECNMREALRALAKEK